MKMVMLKRKLNIYQVLNLWGFVVSQEIFLQGLKTNDFVFYFIKGIRIYFWIKLVCKIVEDSFKKFVDVIQIKNMWMNNKNIKIYYGNLLNFFFDV